MARQYSDAVRDGKRQSVEDTIGTSPKLRIFSGSPPASCADASTGTQGVEMALPVDWCETDGTGTTTKLGVWSGVASADITAGYYRIFDNAGTTCHEQGTVSESGGGGDAIIDSINITNGQTNTVTTYTITENNQ